MRRVSVATLFSALVLAGCGGSAAVKPNVAALKRGLLTSGEMAGMIPAPASPVNSAAAWAGQEQLTGAAALHAEIARLRRIGFVAAISEQMSSPSNNARGGLTLVEQFKSAKGPVAEIANSTATNGPWTLFGVPGIPGARGFEQDGSEGGRNIAFAHGDFYYLIGSGWEGGASNGVSRAQMIAVAQRLYRRVAG